MNENMAKIKARIQALLAKANGTDNEHEAEAFMAKAMELLQEYQLDVSDLVDEDPIIDHPGVTGAKSGHAWRWKLYRAVGLFYGCKSIHVETFVKDKDGEYRTDKHGRFMDGYEQHLIGPESAIITTDLMYPWIVQQVKASAAAIVAKVTEEHGARHAMSVEGQAKRVAAALILRINRLIAENRPKKNPTTPMEKNALVLKDAVLAKYEQLYPDAVSMGGPRPIKTDAMSRAAAEGIGLYRQTSGKSQLRIG